MGADNELVKYSGLLFVSCFVYLLLAGSSTFVPATIMTAVSEELGMSLAYLGALNSAGAGMKAVLIMFLMGPALDKFGPPIIVNICLVGSGVCNILLAIVDDTLLYSAVFMANYVFNSFSEQPAFIVLYATYFEKMLGVASTCIASAFSLAGFVLPLVLSPILATAGYRTLWLVLAAASLGSAPLSFWVLRAGPISLKGAPHKAMSFTTSMLVADFASKLKRKLSSEPKEPSAEGFTGGRVSQFGAVVCMEATAVALDDTDDEGEAGKAAPSSQPAKATQAKVTPPPPVNVTLGEAFGMLKFWALLTACVAFFLYGGQLNLHLPTIFMSEAGKTAVEASSIYSVYNISGVIGKVLTAFFIAVPPLKKTFPIYIPFPLMFFLSHLLILDVSVPQLLDGELLGALSVTSYTPRLIAFCAVAGLGYGFGASIMALLVKEFFGLVDLTKLQPIQYACVIFGNMGGMFLPGYLKGVYGTYTASLLMSFVATAVTFGCFVVMAIAHPIGESPKPPPPKELV